MKPCSRHDLVWIKWHNASSGKASTDGGRSEGIACSNCCFDELAGDGLSCQCGITRVVMEQLRDTTFEGSEWLLIKGIKEGSSVGRQEESMHMVLHHSSKGLKCEV